MHVLLQSLPPTLQQATSNPRLHQRLLDTHRQVSCGVTVPFSWVLVHEVLLCPPRVCFRVLCKFWQLYGGVNGDLLQEDLCNTHTQSPCPCGRPLPTHTSAGDTQAQFCLTFCGVPGFWCAQGLFEPSECLWWEWGLILNVNSPSCNLSGASPLPLNVGYLLTAPPVPIILLGFLWPWTWGIYSRLLHRRLKVTISYIWKYPHSTFHR